MREVRADNDDEEMNGEGDNIEMGESREQNDLCGNSCRRNNEFEEEFGLDSTIISNLDINQSMIQPNLEFNLDINDNEQSFFCGNSHLFAAPHLQ